MVKAITMSQLVRKMEGYSTQVQQGTEKLLLEATKAAMRAAVEATPVDSGRLVSNWIVGRGSEPPTSEPVKFNGPSAKHLEGAFKAAVIAKNLAKIDSWKSGVGKRMILHKHHVVNHTPYAGYVNDGSTTVAPHNMREIGHMAAAPYIGHIKVIKQIP